MKNHTSVLCSSSYHAERPKLIITYSLTVKQRKAKFIEILVFFEQCFEDTAMNKRDVFMTLPKIVQTYFMKEYFVSKKEKDRPFNRKDGKSKLDVRDTATDFRAKNDIKYTFLHKIGNISPGHIATHF
jgi:hypothetical protein